MRRTHALLLLTVLVSGCAANIKDTDLISSNTFFLPPTAGKTIYLQNRNSSDNQAVTLNDLGARLSGKGYQVVQDHTAAHYVVLTNIVYCNLTKPELPVENIVSSGYGSGVGSSIMSGLQGLTSMASMAGPQGAIAGGVASMGLSAASSVGSAIGSMFGGPSRPDANENVNYACVADVQITEQGKSAAAASSAGEKPGSSGAPGVYQTRIAASVHQKKLADAEATPLVQQKLSAAVAGNF
ncbi:MAG: complement resistance protein TraT [Nitrospiraceae bacterium]